MSNPITDLFKQNNKIHENAKNSVFDTENMLPISEIRWDCLILKDGGLRSIIKIDGLNLDLKSYEEQEQIIEQYKKFLNWLDFPIQIFVHNSYLDLTDYIEYMKDKTKNIVNDNLKSYSEQYISFMDNINNKEWLIFIKEFYVIVPYYELEDDAEKMHKARWMKILDVLDIKDSAEKIVERYRWFIKNKKFLDLRANIIIENLKSIWVNAQILNTDQIISLLFRFYNPASQWQQAEIKIW